MNQLSILLYLAGLFGNLGSFLIVFGVLMLVAVGVQVIMMIITYEKISDTIRYRSADDVNLNDGYGVDPRVALTPPHTWRQKINDALNAFDCAYFDLPADQQTDQKGLRQQKIDYAKSLTDPEERKYAFQWIARQ